MIKEEQITEWTESAVTMAMRSYLTKHCEEIAQSRGLDAFTPFDAHKTQEILVGLNGYVDALEFVIELLEGDWSMMEEV